MKNYNKAALMLLVVLLVAAWLIYRNDDQAGSPAPSQSPAPTSQAEPTGSPIPSTTPSVPPSTTVPGDNTVRAALDSIPVKGRAAKTGYEREKFGERWTDDNQADVGRTSRNGCDTRNDILYRDLTDKVVAYNGCKVLSGELLDPYTGKQIDFLCGVGAKQSGKCDAKLSRTIEIDHVVSLSDAWQKGAQQISFEQRTALANDPLNLFAVDGPTNSGKGDSDAASWLPSNTSFRCEFVSHQVAVKKKYSLWVTQAERDAILRVLNTCPGQMLPVE